MRKLVILVVLAVLGGFSLAGCGDDNDSSSSGNDDGGAAVTTPAEEGGTTVSVTLGETSEDEFTMTIDTPTIQAGTVTFDVSNPATNEKKHEMVVLKTDTPADQLKPRANNPDKVEEEGDLGEVELEPGQSKTMTLDLEPGNYVLICNLEKHYAKGMFTSFSVT